MGKPPGDLSAGSRYERSELAGCFFALVRLCFFFARPQEGKGWCPRDSSGGAFVPGTVVPVDRTPALRCGSVSSSPLMPAVDRVIMVRMRNSRRSAGKRPVQMWWCCSSPCVARSPRLPKRHKIDIRRPGPSHLDQSVSTRSLRFPLLYPPQLGPSSLLFESLH